MMEHSTAIKLVRLEIQNRKDTLKLYERIIPVVKKFDGKILNKRFDTALKEIDQNLRYDRRYTMFSIEMWMKNDHVMNEPDSHGYCTCEYIQNRTLTLTEFLYGCYDRQFPERVMTDADGRIKADVIIKGLEEGKQKLEKEIVSLEASLEKVSEYKKKLEELRTEIENTTREIPYLIKDYFDLNYTVNRR